MRKNKIYDESEQSSIKYINSYASRTLAVFPDEYPRQVRQYHPKSIINPVPVNRVCKFLSFQIRDET